jgi:hypothetical protein
MTMRPGFIGHYRLQPMLAYLALKGVDVQAAVSGRLGSL